MEFIKIPLTTFQKADEFASSKGEVLLCQKTTDIKYGLWVNISKNPRIKKIDFLPTPMSIDVPKNLALTSVAIRMIHYSYDPLENKYPSDYTALVHRVSVMTTNNYPREELCMLNFFHFLHHQKK